MTSRTRRGLVIVAALATTVAAAWALATTEHMAGILLTLTVLIGSVAVAVMNRLQ